MTIYGAIPRDGYKQQPRRIPRSLGFARYALSFDGVDDFIDCGNDASLDVTDGLTLVTLAYARANPTRFSDAIVGRVGSYWFEYRDSLSLELVAFINGTWTNVSAGIVDLTTGWHRIVGTYDGTALRIFVNNVERGFRQITGTIDITTNPFQVSSSVPGDAGFNSAFNGLIAGVEVYNRALSAEEGRWNVLNYHNPIRSGLRLWLPMEEGTGEVVYDKSGHGNNGTLLPAGAGPTWQRLRQWELRAAVE